MTDPVRWRAYLVLRSLGEMRAAALAKLMGASEAVVTRHLEVMETLVLVESTRQGTSPRARLWRAVPDGLRVDTQKGGILSAEVDGWMKVNLEVQHSLLMESVDRREEHPTAWQNATEMQNYVLRLTRDELDELGKELEKVVLKWVPLTRERMKEGPQSDTRTVYAVTHAVMYPEPDLT